MQFNKYIKHLHSIQFKDKPLIDDYINGLTKFLTEWNNRNIIPEKKVRYSKFLLPYQKNFTQDKHYNILYIIARNMQVKLMWRNILERDVMEIRKGLWIIGEHPNTVMCWIMLEKYFRGYYECYNWLVANAKAASKKAGYKNVRSYASNQCKVIEYLTYNVYNNKLELDRKYELYLENVIKEMFKLDYKNYPTDKQEYYHAISTHYHHKRLLL